MTRKTIKKENQQKERVANKLQDWNGKPFCSAKLLKAKTTDKTQFGL